jgi:hypothetical protein
LSEKKKRKKEKNSKLIKEKTNPEKKTLKID